MQASGLRIATHLADTGYLLCFGAVPRGLDLLNEIFSGGLGVVPAVRNEVERFASETRNNRRHLRASAQAYTGRRSGILQDVALRPSDVARCEQCLMALGTLFSDGDSPHASVTADAELDDVSAAPFSCGYNGKDSGESESIAVALRLGVALLICDSGGRRVAVAKGLEAESAAESLKRLVGKKSPRELYRIYRSMIDLGTDPGTVVRGHLWFREPTRSPRALGVAPRPRPPQD